jgi:hypothetical protein
MMINSESEEEASYQQLTMSMAECTSSVRWTAPVPETMDMFLNVQKGVGLWTGAAVALAGRFN